jgi:DeoR/GlpR family transcriptional regulator of sugar metabolism
VELVLLGGVVRRNYRSLVGVIAEDALRKLKADVLFLGTSGVDADLGVWDSTMIEVPIKRAMIEAAATVALLADSEKFAMGGLVWVTDVGSIDHIVTDAPLPAACGEAVEASGVEVTIA